MTSTDVTKYDLFPQGTTASNTPASSKDSTQPIKADSSIFSPPDTTLSHSTGDYTAVLNHEIERNQFAQRELRTGRMSADQAMAIAFSNAAAMQSFAPTYGGYGAGAALKANGYLDENELKAFMAKISSWNEYSDENNKIPLKNFNADYIIKKLRALKDADELSVKNHEADPEKYPTTTNYYQQVVKAIECDVLEEVDEHNNKLDLTDKNYSLLRGSLAPLGIEGLTEIVNKHWGISTEVDPNDVTGKKAKATGNEGSGNAGDKKTKATGNEGLGNAGDEIPPNMALLPQDNLLRKFFDMATFNDADTRLKIQAYLKNNLSDDEQQKFGGILNKITTKSYTDMAELRNDCDFINTHLNKCGVTATYRPEYKSWVLTEDKEKQATLTKEEQTTSKKSSLAIVEQILNPGSYKQNVPYHTPIPGVDDGSVAIQLPFPIRKITKDNLYEVEKLLGEKSNTSLLKEIEKRHGQRYNTVKLIDLYEQSLNLSNFNEKEQNEINQTFKVLREACGCNTFWPFSAITFGQTDWQTIEFHFTILQNALNSQKNVNVQTSETTLIAAGGPQTQETAPKIDLTQQIKLPTTTQSTTNTNIFDILDMQTMFSETSKIFNLDTLDEQIKTSKADVGNSFKDLKTAIDNKNWDNVFKHYKEVQKAIEEAKAKKE